MVCRNIRPAGICFLDIGDDLIIRYRRTVQYNIVIYIQAIGRIGFYDGILVILIQNIDLLEVSISLIHIIHTDQCCTLAYRIGLLAVCLVQDISGLQHRSIHVVHAFIFIVAVRTGLHKFTGNVPVIPVALSDHTLGSRIFIGRDKIFIDQEKFLLHNGRIWNLQSGLIIQYQLDIQKSVGYKRNHGICKGK